MTAAEGMTEAGAAYEGLYGRRFVVDVPASSANLGAGYDCLGLAVDLCNTVEVEAVRGDGSISMTVRGEGEGDLVASRDNRFVAGMEEALETALGPLPPALGWRIAMHNRIPLSRGLGSSAAATVGGVVVGDAFARAVGAPAVDPLTLLNIATRIESHPDNAAAVLLGGFVVSAHLGERVEAVRFDAPEGLRCVLFIPERRLSTEDMRRVLPAEVPLRDAVSNMSRIAIGVAGIASGRFELLGDLTIDRIHEPYRSVAYPELPRLTGAARAAGALGAFLSGAGSTVLAFVAPGGDPAPVEAALRDAATAVGLEGRTAVVSPRNAGPEIRPV
ncbi:MAG TPA: homoserine kinase [Candidatus Limnocylindrales bacterium]|nr:homoserine kinase [Candidatus Limnocylindrales bacterium]